MPLPIADGYTANRAIVRLLDHKSNHEWQGDYFDAMRIELWASLLGLPLGLLQTIHKALRGSFPDDQFY